MNKCPLCSLRVQDWHMASGKAVIHEDHIYHKSCLVDYELRHGKKHPADKSLKGDWSIGLYET